MSGVLVIGGAGFIGSHLVDELLVQGHDVIVLDSSYSEQKIERTREWSRRSKKFLSITGKKSDVSQVQRCMDHRSWVFDVTGVHTPVLDHEFADLLEEREVRRWVRTLHFDPMDAASFYKKVTTLVISKVYGPRQPDGTSPDTEYIFVSDVVRACIMTAMNYEAYGTFFLSPHGKTQPERLGWRPHVSLEHGLEVTKLYEQKNRRIILP